MWPRGYVSWWWMRVWLDPYNMNIVYQNTTEHNRTQRCSGANTWLLFMSDGAMTPQKDTKIAIVLSTMPPTRRCSISRPWCEGLSHYEIRPFNYNPISNLLFITGNAELMARSYWHLAAVWNMTTATEEKQVHCVMESFMYTGRRNGSSSLQS